MVEPGAWIAVEPRGRVETPASGLTVMLASEIQPPVARRFQAYLRERSSMAFSSFADLLFGLMIAMALTIKQPFCRICPMLALQAVFKKVGLFRLVKNGSSSCEKCGLCAKVCPTDIFEIQDVVHKPTNITFADCTLCGMCVEFCPDDDVMQLQYAGFPVFKSSKDYFKKRNKDQRGWEKTTWAEVAPK